MKTARLYLAAPLAALAAVSPLLANVQLTGPYSQNFQSMALGTTTPPDWFVGGRSGVDGLVDSNGNGAISGTTVQVDNGSIAASSGTISNFNYGHTGNAGSRSLGSCATTSNGHRAMEVRIDNRMGAPIISFEVRYDGKQWRRENAGPQPLVMKFSTDGVNFVDMGSNFNFTSIQNNQSAGPVDGDSVRTNGIGGVYTPPSPILENSTFYLRWFDLNENGVADHGLAIDNFSLTNIQVIPPGATVLTFQQNVGGYTGAVDTYLQQFTPTQEFSTATVLEWDGEDNSGQNYLLIKFDNLFGMGPGQIKPTDVISSATLTYNVLNAGNTASVNEVAVPWQPTDSWNTFGGEPGVQNDEYGASVGTASGSPLGGNSLDVTSSIIAWRDNPSANLGWIFRPTGGTDGVQVSSSEDSIASQRPKLTVILNAGAPPQKVLTVKHQPYLQLGDAPLANTGPGIGLKDQIVIVWQTIESGSGTAPNDYFEVEYRKTGDPTWIAATPIDVLNTGTQTRVNHSVTITNLDYNTHHEYRVIHKRNPSEPITVATYNGTFTTRRAPDDTSAFKFAAYGDSVNVGSSSDVARFESVMARVTALQAEFVTLMGDNVYDTGTHDAFDGRFDGTKVPNQSAYVRNHIEYYCDGNHDSGDSQNGLPSRQNYYCPIPVQGVTSPVAGPVGEFPEDNYSFDHGLVHFAIIDSTAWGGTTPGISGVVSATRQQNILNWLAADLAASSQPWKVVCTHHPPKSWFGHGDTGEGMAAELIPVLINNGVDLLLVGHSHNYQRSFPLTGFAGGNVTYIMDESGTYLKGDQVIQVVGGTGGRTLESGAPTTATQWLAKAFGSNNGGDVGPILVEVSQEQMTVKYILASNGTVRDQFTIVVPGPSITLSTSTINRTVFLGDSLTDDVFTVKNGGPGTMNYTVSSNAPWVSVNPTGGSSSGEAHPVTVSYDLSGFTLAGQHSATITVASAEATNSPRTITVNLTIETVKPDFDGDGDVDQTDFGHFQECLTGSSALQNNPACQDAKLDNDGDVDGADFTIFRNCMTAANVPADRNCD